MKTFIYSTVIAGAMAVAPLTAANAATIVDVELSLLIDVSGSVDNSEFNLQRQGYVDAFNSSTIHDLITSTANGRLGQIAVNVIYWSGASQQAEAVGWTVIDSAAAASSFASTLAGAARTSNGNTAPGSAINYAVNSINGNDITGTSTVIDVSGDGERNEGANTAAARDAAIAGGVTRINGIAIGGTSLKNWYEDNIMGGTDAFVLQATSFDTFGEAIYKKLYHEIGGTNPNPVPLPAAAWLLGGAIAGLGMMRRRQRG